jgi:hypothetical protein
MKKIFLFFILALISSTVLAYVDPVAPYMDPLPDEKIDIIFKKIENKEIILTKTLHQALKSSQLTLRAYAARELGNQGDETSIPYLIDVLSDESSHVGANYIEPGMATTRYWANESLKKLTGEDFNFVWNDPKEKRTQAIFSWQQWYFDKYKKK